jgi:hypothetical protein
MLDKIRLEAAGKLPPEYFTGVEDPTHFDARCTRFLGVNYDELARKRCSGDPMRNPRTTFRRMTSDADLLEAFSIFWMMRAIRESMGALGQLRTASKTPRKFCY